MLEDKLLVWKLKNGNPEALRLIYEKYKNDLFALALTLSDDRSCAEDALHDVFVSLARFVPKLTLTTDLKSYLASSVANRLRNIYRAQRKTSGIDNLADRVSTRGIAEENAISKEMSQQLSDALTQIPADQREVVILHLQSGLKFRQIAKQYGVSINTIQSRYRYAIDKLKTLLNNEV